MPRTSDLKTELSQLKADSQGKARPRRSRARKSADEDNVIPPEPAAEDASEKNELGDLANKLSDLVENAGDEIRERPVTAVLGALALGVVIGALLRR
ncbi:hypothetical protein [Labrenzia sp. 011]|uniref:hypothetical protein n=1 Tax=Labrenzia sp. 011 TaxID=2171494 RepID=UPI000D513852|nr:hypothetical protein [Labrenzia sp. 011]PVB63715.1 hypothetical protein DCO57_02740 [Labrenzia sp. 011]